MPTVPMYNQRQVQSAALPAGGVSVQTSPDTFGAGFGEFGQRVAGLFAEHQEKANIALSQDALLQFQQFADDQMNNPETGLMTKQGKNAIGQADATMNNIRGKADELMQQVPEAMRKNFLQQVNQYGMQYKNQASRYEIGQVQQYETGQFQGILTTGAKNVAQMYGDNRAYVDGNRQIFDQIEQFGSAHGWSAEQIQAKKVEFKETVADSALSQWSASNAMAFIESNGELSDTAAGSRRATAGGGESPDGNARGLRNNNPGNLEYSQSNPWSGQTGSDGRFARFETPQHGIRALGRNLLSYQRQGFDTVNEIINRWAPPKENKTDKYIEAVCGQLGVKPDQPIDASNPDVLKALCAAIIHHENGSQPYSDQELSGGVSAALGLSALPEAGKRYTGNAAFDAASPQAQAAFLRQADQQRKQQQAEYRVQVDGRVRDASAAYMRGVEFPNPPQQSDFIAAYGMREGSGKYTEFRNTQIAGQYIGSFRNMPTSSINAYVDQLKPTTEQTSEGYAARAALYDNVVTAAHQVIQQRKADPVQFSLSSGQAQPVDFSNQNNFGQSVALRASQVGALSQAFGTPLTFFSKDEANQIGTFFRDAPVSQQSAYLDTIHKSTGGGKVYMAALQQISVNAPSAAVAGILMDKPGGIVAEKNWFNPDITVSPVMASQTILAGAAARKGSKEAKGMTMPKDLEMRQEFTDQVQDAFAGDAQGAAMAYEVAKDYYAGMLASKGNFSGELDSSVWKQAINVATGGVYDYNGQGNVLLPWGMSADTFDTQVNHAWKDQVIDAGVNTPVGQYGLQSFGDSQYLVKLGAGYLLKPDGSPVVLDLTRQRLRFGGDIPQ